MSLKLNLEYIHFGSTKLEKYYIAFVFGRELTNFLEEDIFSLLTDSYILINSNAEDLRYLSSYTFRLHPASKALEGFLNKLIKRKKLAESKSDKIGEIFGKKDSIVRKKIKNSKLIARTKSVWDFCRNDVNHFDDDKKINWSNTSKRFQEIMEIIQLLHEDFYGKSETDDEIQKGFEEYNNQLRQRRQKNL